ncbi:MAG: RNA polymerase sigma factor [Patescibacteria group bacterium]|nr:RNA polymerase sigma factor [Patescibacteria group bacterium]
MNFFNKNKIEDADLVLQFQKNQNKECFEQLYDKYIDIVYRKCLSYLGNQNDAQDAAQEIWIKVYFTLLSFEHRSKFSTWLYRIVVNYCITVLKKRKYFVSLNELQDTGFDVQDLSPSIDIALSNQEDVTKALSMLSKDMKALLLMKYVEEYTYEEIAQITGLSPSAIKMRIARAKKQLQTSFIKGRQKKP